MAESTRRRWAGWWLAALAILFVVAALGALLRPVGGRRLATAPAVSAPKVKVAVGDRLLQEQATIFDPTPLFLPTKWNASQRPLPAAVQRQPGQVFKPYRAKLIYGEAGPALTKIADDLQPKTPLDLLRQPSRDPFLGFDRQDVPLKPLPSRLGMVEVRRIDGGEIQVPGADPVKVLMRPLEENVTLPAGRLDWRPPVFLVDVTVGGLLGRPVIVSSSDIEEVDSFLREYISKTLRLGELLPPGIYQVVVGP